MSNEGLTHENRGNAGRGRKLGSRNEENCDWRELLGPYFDEVVAETHREIEQIKQR